MNNKIFLLIVLWSAVFALWTFANPPAGTPGTTSGAISADSSGNVGVGTSTPATKLDVNGATTIRGSLDMKSNKIINLAAPVDNKDAATKEYVDLYGASSVDGTDARLWGLGRPGVSVLNTSGNCPRTVGGKTVKVSRGTRNTTWDATPSSCPAGWWVCKESEIGGSGACGSSIAVNALNCQPGAASDEFLLVTYTGGWLADGSANAQASKEYKGKTMDYNGTIESVEEICSVLPAWCCAYQ